MSDVSEHVVPSDLVYVPVSDTDLLPVPLTQIDDDVSPELQRKVSKSAGANNCTESQYTAPFCTARSVFE